jgi:hypothetical protein
MMLSHDPIGWLLIIEPAIVEKRPVQRMGLDASHIRAHTE